MPELEDLGLDVDLRAAPWLYPGPLPTTSGLLAVDRFARLTGVRGRRLGQARVDLRPGEDGERCTDVPLNYQLLRHNAMAIDGRALVVAIGSNASPAVMRKKLRAAGQSPVLPMVRGTLQGVAVGHSAHVSAPGYIAAAPRIAPGSNLDVNAALLDTGQLECLDETEPNYVRCLLTTGLQLENGERPTAFYLYASRWGLLADSEGDPLPFGSQRDLLRALLTSAPSLARSIADASGVDAIEEPEMLLPVLARDGRLRGEVRELFASGWTTPSGLADQVSTSAALTYGRTSSTWESGPLGPAESLEVVGSSNAVQRAGEPVVVLHSATARDLGVRLHAVVGPGTRPERPKALARVLTDDAVPRGEVAADQVIRNALGVELRERVVVGPAVVRHNRLSDAVVARPHYVMCRVQTADLATVEQPVCLMAPLAMSILGIESGDEVVIEGMPDSSDDGVATIRLKAHAVPEEVQSRREQLGGGQLDSRFPAARDALAVYPDLPWIFLDASARTELGLTGKLAAVRVRASRRHQVSQEIRELLLVLVIAFIGLSSLISSVAILGSVLACISVVALFLIRLKVRMRLRSVMTRAG